MARRRFGLGIQSKLLIMLLVVSVLSTVVIGVIGVLNGRDSLRSAVFDQLQSLRETRAGEIERTFSAIQAGVVLDSRNANTVAASRDFNAAFEALDDETLTAAEGAALEAYYADVFVPQLEERSQSESDPEVFIPTDPAQRYVQSAYTVPAAGDFDQAIAVDDAGDGSEWSAAHAQYHDGFRLLVESLGYEDLLLLNRDGDVVYSAYSGVDLGTNVVSGPYAGGALSQAFGESVRSNSIDGFAQSDFDRYQPSYGVPTAWITSPVGSDGEVTGVLAVQLPTDRINVVTTGNGAWESDGLGDTGEVYLVGPDETMRSSSRLLLQDPEEFERRVISGGTPPATAARQVFVKGTVLLQSVRADAVQSALVGEAVEQIETGYDGRETLIAAAPLYIDGLQWVIVSSKSSEEAFQPVGEFTRTVLIATAAIVLLIALLSLLLAQIFTRPVATLSTAVRRVAAGETDVEVDASRRDEFGDLGAAFNDMSRNLQTKAELLEQQRDENERLLLTLMPETVARRYQEGEETIAEDHTDVAVVFADLVGSDAYFSGKKSEVALSAVNGLMRGFDEAAERLGVERVRPLRDGYLASCGLVVPRVDNVRRAVDFAIEMQAVVERFNAANGTRLSLRVGVDSGTVSSGLVGRESLAYDLWGDAVNVANAVRSVAGSPGVFVSDRVHSRLREGEGFEQVGALPDGTAVWGRKADDRA